MQLDHTTLLVPQAKHEAIIKFLLDSLQHMGMREHMRPYPLAVGLGDKTSFFWVNALPSTSVDDKTLETVLKRSHIAFTAQNNQDVDLFHAAALKAGATCNGPPGPRPHYHPDYYGAFVLDPVCGINFEVVSRAGNA